MPAAGIHSIEHQRAAVVSTPMPDLPPLLHRGHLPAQSTRTSPDHQSSVSAPHRGRLGPSLGTETAPDPVLRPPAAVSQQPRRAASSSRAPGSICSAAVDSAPEIKKVALPHPGNTGI